MTSSVNDDDGVSFSVVMLEAIKETRGIRPLWAGYSLLCILLHIQVMSVKYCPTTVRKFNIWYMEFGSSYDRGHSDEVHSKLYLHPDEIH